MRSKRSRPFLTLVFRVNDTNADSADQMEIKAASNRNGAETSVPPECSKTYISEPTQHFQICPGPPKRAELHAGTDQVIVAADSPKLVESLPSSFRLDTQTVKEVQVHVSSCSSRLVGDIADVTELKGRSHTTSAKRKRGFESRWRNLCPKRWRVVSVQDRNYKDKR